MSRRSQPQSPGRSGRTRPGSSPATTPPLRVIEDTAELACNQHHGVVGLPVNETSVNLLAWFERPCDTRLWSWPGMSGTTRSAAPTSWPICCGSGSTWRSGARSSIAGAHDCGNRSATVRYRSTSSRGSPSRTTSPSWRRPLGRSTPTPSGSPSPACRHMPSASWPSRRSAVRWCSTSTTTSSPSSVWATHSITSESTVVGARISRIRSGIRGPRSVRG